VLSDNVSSMYADWFLGHAGKSVYYTKKEPERRKIYATAEKYLTVLDYSLFEAHGRNVEQKLIEKEQEIQILREREAVNTHAIAALRQNIKEMQDIVSGIVKNPEKLKELMNS
jgi:hypothetical protein